MIGPDPPRYALQSEPLTVYDYPGLVVSAQPAYPAIPTPSQPA